MSRDSGRYTIAEAAERLKVSRVTLFRWIKRGWVTDAAKDYKGDRVFTEEDLSRIRAWQAGLTRPARGKRGKGA